MFRSPTVGEWLVVTLFYAVVYGWALYEFWPQYKSYREQTRHERKKKP